MDDLDRREGEFATFFRLFHEKVSTWLFHLNFARFSSSDFYFSSLFGSALLLPTIDHLLFILGMILKRSVLFMHFRRVNQYLFLFFHLSPCTTVSLILISLPLCSFFLFFLDNIFFSALFVDRGSHPSPYRRVVHVFLWTGQRNSC